MKSIELKNTLPLVLKASDCPQSDVWNKEVTFERGRSYLVEAESGRGKSSLCSFVYGQRQDYQGTILFDGEDIRCFPLQQWTVLRRKSVSLLFQDLRLFPELTAYENVQLKNSLTNYKTEEEIVEWFVRLGIKDKLNQYVSRMSFGQQQRVALIRALCQPMDFLFLDEPVSHLDDDNGHVMAELITEEAQRQEAGIIVTSIGKRLDLNYDYVLKL